MSDEAQLARWAHMWAAAAVHTCDSLESTWDEDEVATSIGARDCLSLVLVDAIRNVYRGAVAVCGPKAEAVAAFETELPTLKDLRDRLEHFDEYVVGKGRAQKSAEDAPKGIKITTSEGGGPDGHVVTIAVAERSRTEPYKFASRTATDAARRLAWAIVSAAGLDDARHQRCLICIRP